MYKNKGGKRCSCRQQNTSTVIARLASFYWAVLGLSMLAVAAGVRAGHGGAAMRKSADTGI